jgi:hypothetical protein
MDRNHLPISLLDDLSYEVNKDEEFRKMVKSANGIDRDVRIMLAGDDKTPPRITDPRKRLCAFVIEKLKETADDYIDKSAGDVRVFEHKLDLKQKYDFKRVFPNTLSTYLWRDNNGIIQRRFRANCEYRQDPYSGNSYRGNLKQSTNLAELIGCLGRWEKSLLDEFCIIDDMRCFPLKQVGVPTLKLPVPDRSVPFRVYEGNMTFDSDRDANGKLVVTGRQARVAKRVFVSVQMVDYRNILATSVLYHSI